MSERADLRLRILLILKGQMNYIANQEVIISKLRDQGYAVNRDQLHIELAWLDQNADAIVDQVSGGVHIATLTGDGLEIAEGVRELPGIRRLRPGE
jgi:hypothetical protein